MSALTLRQLEYFVATAEAGTVTGAAQRLRLSQSAVSTALADLEHALGVQLFLRHARGLRLTRAGQRILVESQRLLGEVDELHVVARELHTELSGPLVVGCYSTLSATTMPTLVDRFLAEHPDVRLQLVDGSYPELLSRLREGECELAILYDYRLQRHSPLGSFATLRLTSATPYALLPEAHPLAAAERVSLRQLVDEPMVLFDLPPAGDYFRSLFEAHDLAPRVRVRSDSFEVVRGMVARGLGYTLLNQRPRQPTSYEGLPTVARPLVEDLPSLDIVAVVPTGVRLTRRAHAFLSHARSLWQNSEPSEKPNAGP